MNILELLQEIESNPHNANYAIMDYIALNIGAKEFAEYMQQNYDGFCDFAELHIRANEISKSIKEQLKESK
jgi:signal-transduction protein with cAMP-binding, CBS, and nucleotidyltransferase domain